MSIPWGAVKQVPFQALQWLGCLFCLQSALKAYLGATTLSKKIARPSSDAQLRLQPHKKQCWWSVAVQLLHSPS